jgi:RNase P protein component
MAEKHYTYKDRLNTGVFRLRTNKEFDDTMNEALTIANKGRSTFSQVNTSEMVRIALKVYVRKGGK